jgi:hypothetical protein
MGLISKSGCFWLDFKSSLMFAGKAMEGYYPRGECLKGSSLLEARGLIGTKQGAISKLQL